MKSGVQAAGRIKSEGRGRPSKPKRGGRMFQHITKMGENGISKRYSTLAYRQDKMLDGKETVVEITDSERDAKARRQT